MWAVLLLPQESYRCGYPVILPARFAEIIEQPYVFVGQFIVMPQD